MGGGRILGLDYGRRRIGVAVSDPMGLIAQPVETLIGLSDAEAVESIGSCVVDLGVEKIVVGNPLTLKGLKSNSGEKVEQFVVKLAQRISLPIILWDERFTSVEAQRVLHQMSIKPSRKKEKVDLIASVLLLQNYLDYMNRSSVADLGDPK